MCNTGTRVVQVHDVGAVSTGVAGIVMLCSVTSDKIVVVIATFITRSLLLLSVLRVHAEMTIGWNFFIIAKINEIRTPVWIFRLVVVDMGLASCKVTFGENLFWGHHYQKFRESRCNWFTWNLRVS